MKKQCAGCGQWITVDNGIFIHHIKQKPSSADKQGVVAHEPCPGSNQSVNSSLATKPS